MVRKGWITVWLFGVGVWLWGTTLPAQETSDPVVNALDARVSQFLEGVSLGATQKAYQELLAGSPLLKQAEGVAALVEKTSQLKDNYGEYRAFERIAAKPVGRDLVLLRYLYKCEHFPVVWYFTFYRTPPRGDLPAENNNWRVITMRFDTRLELLAL